MFVQEVRGAMLSLAAEKSFAYLSVTVPRLLDVVTQAPPPQAFISIRGLFW